MYFAVLYIWLVGWRGANTSMGLNRKKNTYFWENCITSLKTDFSILSKNINCSQMPKENFNVKLKLLLTVIFELYGLESRSFIFFFFISKKSFFKLHFSTWRSAYMKKSISSKIFFMTCSFISSFQNFSISTTAKDIALRKNGAFPVNGIAPRGAIVINS